MFNNNNNHDVLLRIMEFLGPRHVCLTLGSTCHGLRHLSQSNSLWKIFWGKRCLNDSDMVSVSRDDDDNMGIDSDTTNATSPHDAAMVFRRAMNATNITIIPMRSMETDNKCSNDIDAIISEADGTILSLYQAYIDQHISMKESNLRVKLPPLSDIQIDTMKQLELRHRTCTQTWPGQLSLLHDDIVDLHSNRLVTCQKSAVVWCDHPNCSIARCGVQGCVRSYRFASPFREEDINIPRVHNGGGDNSMGERIGRDCSDRNYDMLSFVQCSWCRVQFCLEHVYSRTNGYYYQRKTKHHGRGQRSYPWYKCEECNLSSCPDCISQVFLTSPPNMDGCGVVTAGKVCHRTVCPQCIWYVGWKKQGSNNTASMFSGNVPGGDYSKLSRTEVCTVRGMDLLLASKNTSGKVHNNLECWDEFETCCSKCLRHVDFRWRELTQVQDSFHGFMP